MEPRPRGRPRKQPSAPKRRPGRPRCAARDAAKAAGQLTYVHTPCPKCGGVLRWVRNYNCIECRRACQRAADARRRDELEAELMRWVAKVGAERLQQAVVGAFVGRGLPVQGATRSGRRSPRRKPEEPVA